MVIDKRTVVTVVASTAIGFLGDLMVYSLAESKGKPFRIHMPKGKQLVTLIALGIIVGVGIDWAVKAVDEAQKTAEEKALDKLLENERVKIMAGEIKGKIPTSIVWQAA